jgi:hypothetical protein
MLDIEAVIAMLHRPETDAGVKALLTSIQVKHPLKRPKRGDSDVYVIAPDERLSLCFSTAESVGLREAGLREEELVLSAVFLEPKDEHDDLTATYQLPFGIPYPLTRSAARERFGAPAWSSPLLNNDRWHFGKTKLLACFSDDEKSVKQFVFSPLR